VLRAAKLVVPENLKWTDFFPAIEAAQALFLSIAGAIISSSLRESLD
jgi:hypothetical protein